MITMIPKSAKKLTPSIHAGSESLDFAGARGEESIAEISLLLDLREAFCSGI